MVFGPASRLGVSLFEETPCLELIPGRSEEEVETIIRAVYRQVLGNAYVMESERATIPESQFKSGALSVREFVRALAKSDVYRSRFFDTCPRYRFLELNFKHLLGRTPDGLEEMRVHSTILDTEGYEADIDSYLDSDEYQRLRRKYRSLLPRLQNPTRTKHGWVYSYVCSLARCFQQRFQRKSFWKIPSSEQICDSGNPYSSHSSFRRFSWGWLVISR
jgi:hypothetical protein